MKLFWHRSSMCSICSFQRTAQIKLTLLKRVDVGERPLDEVGRESHGGRLWQVMY
jgi:hypothetical protein